jgi:hypothetical protein
MEFTELGWGRQMGDVPIGFLPSDLANLELWYRFNSGISAPAGVDQWDDQSGNARHLKQATPTNRPSKEADGSILFDGIDNFLKADAYTSNQPTTIYFLGKQVTWTGSDRIYDGNVNNSGVLQQFTATPQLRLFAGAVLGNISPALDTYVVISVVINGVSSVLQLNNDAPVEGDAGASNMGGFVLGAGGALADFGNIQAKEIIKFQAAHDAATRATNINYLADVGGLSI